MRSSTKRIISILIAGFLLISGLVIYANFIRPAFEEIMVLRGEVAARTKVLSEQRAAIKQVQDLISQFESVARLQETLSLALPLKENIPQALGQYQAIALLSRASLQGASILTLANAPSAAQSVTPLAKGIGKLRFDLKALGSYEAIRDFVEGLETTVRLTDLVKMKIEKGGEEGENLFLAAFTVDAYYQAR